MPKVMLVEDDNNLSEIYQARMLAEGYDIVMAHDGEEALAVAATEKPDLIVSDVMMPKISGFEMLDILRNTEGLKQTKVIMLTALGQAEDRSRADSLGADRYLVKSQVTLEDIVTAAQDLLKTGQATAVPATVATSGDAMAASSALTPQEQQLPAPVKPLEPTAPFEPVPMPVAQPFTPAPVSEQPVSMPVAAAPAPAMPAPVASVPPVTPQPVAMPPAEAPLPVQPVAAPQPAFQPEAPAPSQPVSAFPGLNDPVPQPAQTAPVQPTPVPQPVSAPAPAPAQEIPSAPAIPPVAPVVPVAPAPAPAPYVEPSAPVISMPPNPIMQPPVMPSPPAPAPAPAPVLPAPIAPTPQPQPAEPSPAPLQPAVEPLAVPAQPAVTPAPEVSPTPAAPDDQMMNDAIAKLLASTGEPQPQPVQVPQPAEPATAVTPVQPTVSNDESVDDEGVPRKKVIKPITDPSDRPDLDALLAAQEAKDRQAPSDSLPVVIEPKAEPVQPPDGHAKPADPHHQPGNVVTPQPIQPPQPATAPQQPKSTVFDPNSISL